MDSPDGGDAARHADHRYGHRARVREQQRAADGERGDAAEGRPAMPIPSRDGTIADMP
jgi:hypothetical protein